MLWPARKWRRPMRIIGSRSWLVAIAAAAALGVSQTPALGAPDAAPTISISAKSGIKPVTGDVFVVFKAGSLSNAKIKGTVASATSGQVLQLFAQKFPFKKAPAKLGSPITLSGTSAPYSFSVTPTLHTRYQVELFTDSSETTMVAKSAVQAVFVVAHGKVTGVKRCRRPVCHQRIHITVTVPPSTLRTERHKAWHLYFGLHLSRTGTPSAPRRLILGGGHARVVGTRKVSSQQYAMTFTLSFRVGNNGFFFLFNVCQ